MTKHNAAGRECPPWCESDHENAPRWSCEKQSPHVQAESSQFWAVLSLGPADNAEPEVSLMAACPSGQGAPAWMDFPAGAGAERAARVVEMLADATPDDHRTLAAQLRGAAAEAFPDQEAEAGA